MSVVSSPLVQYFSLSLTSSPTNITTNRQIPYPSATYFTEGGVKKLRLRLPTGTSGVGTALIQLIKNVGSLYFKAIISILNDSFKKSLGPNIR